MYDLFNRYIDDKYVAIAINKFKVGQKRFLNMLASIQSKFLKEEYSEMAAKELSFMASNRDWKKYKEWEKNRNPERKKMEAKAGYDTKHASTLIRLMTVGTEILEGKGVLVDRTNVDREDLMDIRFDDVKFDDVIEEYEKIEAKLDEKYKESKLQKTADIEKINQLKMNLIENYVWLKAQMHKNYDAVCKAIDIHAQAVTATFVDNQNELSHHAILFFLLLRLYF